MDIYNAIMKAADQVQREPDRYDFGGGMTPDCGSPSCMLGWIGHFLGLKQACNMDVGKALGLPTTRPFYERVSDLLGHSGYIRSAADAAQGMRLYAAKYHAPARRSDAELGADLVSKIVGPVVSTEAKSEELSW